MASEGLPRCPFCGNEHPEIASGDMVICRCWASAPYDVWCKLNHGPATAKLLAEWKAARAEHKRVGIPDEIIRVTPKVVDAILAEHEPEEPEAG